MGRKYGLLYAQEGPESPEPAASLVRDVTGPEAMLCGFGFTLTGLSMFSASGYSVFGADREARSERYVSKTVWFR